MSAGSRLGRDPLARLGGRTGAPAGQGALRSLLGLASPDDGKTPPTSPQVPPQAAAAAAPQADIQVACPLQAGEPDPGVSKNVLGVACCCILSQVEQPEGAVPAWGLRLLAALVPGKAEPVVDLAAFLLAEFGARRMLAAGLQQPVETPLCLAATLMRGLDAALPMLGKHVSLTALLRTSGHGTAQLALYGPAECFADFPGLTGGRMPEPLARLIREGLSFVLLTTETTAELCMMLSPTL